MTRPASRRGLILGLAALPLAGGAALGSGPSDLACTCLREVERWDWLDSAGNADGMSDEAWDAEFARQNAVFNRAIDEPSASLHDMAAKATMMLQDLDRFHPAERERTDDFRLMRVLLREVIALCA